ncbi:hypothetical protein AAZV13_04G015800 [Glycine max]
MSKVLELSNVPKLLKVERSKVPKMPKVPELSCLRSPNCQNLSCLICLRFLRSLKYLKHFQAQILEFELCLLLSCLLSLFGFQCFFSSCLYDIIYVHFHLGVICCSYLRVIVSVY